MMKQRWIRWALAWLVACALNHAWGLVRRPGTMPPDLLPRSEAPRGLGEARGVSFPLLATWNPDPRYAVPEPPQAVGALQDQHVRIEGYMTSLEGGRETNLFLLSAGVRAPDAPLPPVNASVLVVSEDPVPIFRGVPVAVRGRFFLDPNPDRGFIYRMTCEGIESVGEGKPKTRLPLDIDEVVDFDFAWLEELPDPSPSAKMPAALVKRDGQAVVVSGHVVARDEDPPPVYLIAGRHEGECADLCAQPTHRSAVPVQLRLNARTVPDKASGATFVGWIELRHDPTTWERQSPVQIVDAVLGDPRGERRGPLLPIWAEALVGLAILATSLVQPWRRRRYRAQILTGDMFAQEAAFSAFVEGMRDGEPVEAAIAVLGKPQAKLTPGPRDGQEEEEVWIYALDRSTQGPFLEPVGDLPTPDDLAEWRVGRCGAVLHVRDGRLVRQRHWTAD